jgi:hypothetical protein
MVVGKLERAAAVAAGASKEKADNMVPTTPETVRPTYVPGPEPVGAEHANAVAESHDVVEHTAALRATVLDRAYGPKLMPATVNVAPPIAGPFHDLERVATGASKVSWYVDVPTTIAAVTNSEDPRPLPTGTTHWSVVDDDQATVAQLDRPSRTLAVGEAVPKLKPAMVRVVPPVSGALNVPV